jgi:hypothetical protein
VSDYLQLDHYYKARNLEGEKGRIITLLESLHNISADFFLQYESLIGRRNELETKVHKPFAFIDFQLFHSYFTSFISLQFKNVSIEAVENATTILRNLRIIFVDNYQHWESATKNINANNVVSFFARLEKFMPTMKELNLQLKVQIQKVREYQPQKEIPQPRPSLPITSSYHLLYVVK